MQIYSHVIIAQCLFVAKFLFLVVMILSIYYFTSFILSIEPSNVLNSGVRLMAGVQWLTALLL